MGEISPGFLFDAGERRRTSFGGYCNRPCSCVSSHSRASPASRWCHSRGRHCHGKRRPALVGITLSKLRSEIEDKTRVVNPSDDDHKGTCGSVTGRRDALSYVKSYDELSHGEQQGR